MTELTDSGVWICSSSEYHAETEHISSTKLRAFIEDANVYYRTYIEKSLPGKKRSDEMLIGECVHSLVLENEQTWNVWEGGTRRGKEWDAFVVSSFGKPILTSDQHEAVIGMYEGVMRNQTAADLLEAGGDPELSGKWLHPSGIRVKARWDRLLHDGRVIDLKTASSLKPHFLGKRVVDFGYHIQAALYMEVANALSLTDDGPWTFIWACSEPPYKCYVQKIPDWAIDAGMRAVDNGLRDLAKRNPAKPEDWLDPLESGIHEMELPRWFESEVR